MNKATEQEIDGIISEIIAESDYTSREVKRRTIVTWLNRGVSREEVIALYVVSSDYRRTNFNTRRMRYDYGKYIPIGTLHKFARQFFPDGFNGGTLGDAIDGLATIIANVPPENRFKYTVSQCANVKCILERAIELAQDFAIYDLDDFSDFVTKQESWWMCDMLDIDIQQSGCCSDCELSNDDSLISPPFWEDKAEEESTA